MDGDLEEDDVRSLSPLLPRLRTDATVSPSVGPGVLKYSPGLFWCVSKGCVEWVLMSLSCTPCVLSLADRTGVLCNCDALFTLLSPSSSPLRVVSRPRRGDPRTRPTRSIPDPPLPPTHFRSSLRSQSSLMPRFTTWRSKAKRRRGFPFVPCRRPNEASLTCPPSARGRAPGQRAPYNLCCASVRIPSSPSLFHHARYNPTRPHLSPPTRLLCPSLSSTARLPPRRQPSHPPCYAFESSSDRQRDEGVRRRGSRTNTRRLKSQGRPQPSPLQGHPHHHHHPHPHHPHLFFRQNGEHEGPRRECERTPFPEARRLLSGPSHLESRLRRLHSQRRTLPRPWPKTRLHKQREEPRCRPHGRSNLYVLPLSPYLQNTDFWMGAVFTPGLGACGRVNTDASIIVAVSHLLFDTFPGHTSNPNLNPICGKTLRVMWGGKYTNVVVVDRCEGCGMWDLDFSPTAWARFGQPPSAGRLMGAQVSVIFLASVSLY
jgi:hypothetical protein